MALLACLVALCPSAVTSHVPRYPSPPPRPRGGLAVNVQRGGRARVVLTRVANFSAWLCIHNGTPVEGGAPYSRGQGEGPWNATGFYEGGLQMDHSFSTTYGADMWRKYGAGPHAWTPREQMIVAERARKTRGFGPWPNTARACGLL